MPREMPVMLHSLLEAVHLADMPTLRALVSTLGYELVSAPDRTEPEGEPLVWEVQWNTSFYAVSYNTGTTSRRIQIARGTVLREDTSPLAQQLCDLLRGSDSNLHYVDPIALIPPTGVHIYSHERLVRERGDAVLRRYTPTEREASAEEDSLYLVTADGHVVKQLLRQMDDELVGRETRTVRVLSHLFRETPHSDVLRPNRARFYPVEENTENVYAASSSMYSVSLRERLEIRAGAALFATRISTEVIQQENNPAQFMSRIQGSMRDWQDTLGRDRGAVMFNPFQRRPHSVDPSIRIPPEVEETRCVRMGIMFMVPGVYAPTRLIGYGGPGYAIPPQIAQQLRREAYIPITASMILPARLEGPLRWMLSAGRHHMRRVIRSSSRRTRRYWYPLHQYHEGCMGDLDGLSVVMDDFRPRMINDAVNTLRARVDDAYSRINVSSPSSSEPDGMMNLGILRKYCEKGVHEDATARIL